MDFITKLHLLNKIKVVNFNLFVVLKCLKNLHFYKTTNNSDDLFLLFCLFLLLWPTLPWINTQMLLGRGGEACREEAGAHPPSRPHSSSGQTGATQTSSSGYLFSSVGVVNRKQSWARDSSLASRPRTTPQHNRAFRDKKKTEIC